ncbi:ABC transporter substrate-binding protein [Paenibacillus sp. 1011MAR3C5]|uniref:metal ABC transporter solute-binding protein, Zn/Mn family n=1 Tax=Paenibacillus sp. 1011MAR3C5 TaxID=1675787 RepID=UPI000E6C9846|nr:zinc ABC transporter substrate-binding protein [Paenibacillus sp. 1011MAR3C5]RJE89924.1 ABC transporter substrate-binding protein [Paenibacillus sp. 1011MAR3C5]
MLKRNRSKWLTMFVMLMSVVLVMSACGKSNSSNQGASPPAEPSQTASNGADNGEETSQPKLQVVTSFYPLYYLASEIGGEHVEVVNLIAAGVEPHDWTPKSKDLSTASNAQLLLYHGAGLELWIDQFLKGLSKDSKVVTKEMSAGISLISGNADDHDHAHDHDGEDHDHDAEEGHSHSHDTDPHTWVSPKSAIILAENVKYSLIETDPVHEDYYTERFETVKNELVQLDQKYTEVLEKASQKNLVVSHQAFGYLARDYGLTQTSIMGLSPDAEPRAQDILKIAKFVKENGVKYIFFEELVSDRLAKTLASEAGVETMVLNPLEGLTKEQEQTGATYVTLMESNLQNLTKALQ